MRFKQAPTNHREIALKKNCFHVPTTQNKRPGIHISSVTALPRATEGRVHGIGGQSVGIEARKKGRDGTGLSSMLAWFGRLDELVGSVGAPRILISDGFVSSLE